MLLRDVSLALRRLRLRGRSVLVAVSGGVDSVTLARALRELPEREGLRLSIGHVHHGLRGADADADQAAVERLAVELRLRVRTARIDPPARRAGGTSRDRPSPAEAARELRYAALLGMAEAEGAEVVATAHTADDQAETVLLRILRGTGPDGLAGIPERSFDGRVVRPLLRTTRAEVERFAADRGLAWREDRSNASSVHPRNRLRREWLPGLASAFNPRLLRALADLAEAQRRDSEWIEVLVDREARERFAAEGQWLRIRAVGWHALPEALSRRLARRALARCGAARLVARRHLERMDDFLRRGRPDRQLEVPGPLQLVCDRDGFRLGPALRDLGDDRAPRMLSFDAVVGISPQDAP